MMEGAQHTRHMLLSISPGFVGGLCATLTLGFRPLLQKEQVLGGRRVELCSQKYARQAHYTKLRKGRKRPLGACTFVSPTCGLNNKAREERERERERCRVRLCKVLSGNKQAPSRSCFNHFKFELPVKFQFMGASLLAGTKFYTIVFPYAFSPALCCVLSIALLPPVFIIRFFPMLVQGSASIWEPKLTTINI